MKKIYLAIIFILFQLHSFSQTMQSDKYELFLLSIVESEVNISKGMYMTNNLQYYYEGKIEVNFFETGETKTFTYFFTTWDDKYKEFLIKDKNRNNIEPKIEFDDKKTAMIGKGDDKKSFEIQDNSTIEKAILATMVVWLDNHKEN